MSAIAIYTTRSMPATVRRRLFERSGADLEKVISIIKPSIEAVRMNGDAAILEKYASRNVPIRLLRVSEEEFAAAKAAANPDFEQAFEVAKTNITAVCKEQLTMLQSQRQTTLYKGAVRIWRLWVPEQSVGIYAPGGRANYPSTVLMCAIPAQVAGCSSLTLTVPPRSDGTLPPEVLVAAKKLGIQNVFKIGGAQAIAALAYGTESVPKCSLVVGPGNQYVTAAKLALLPTIRIDSPAGPSENLIIADESAEPSWIAADLLTDCEHGPDSTGILITPSASFAGAVQQEIDRQIQLLSTAKTIRASLKQFGAIVVTATMTEAISLANEYAPEHMQIVVRNAKKVARQITAAGSVFIGPYSAKAAGDYTTGANHVLPTSGLAKSFGPLSVDTFGSYIEFQSVTKKGLEKMRKSIQTFATVEELPAHRNSVDIRYNKGECVTSKGYE